MSRSSLATGRRNNRDEFYTLYKDVKFELDHYLDQFKDKIIYCPCDSEESAFVKYFLELESNGFIKRLLFTSLTGGVDFLGDTAISLYKQSDIIVTNPPFSLFRPFIELIDSQNKGFILWANQNAITYKQTIKLIINNKIYAGYITNKTCTFEVPKEYSTLPKVYNKNHKFYCDVPACTVFTNLVVSHKPLLLSTSFSEYMRYDNFDAININRVSEIPDNYYSLMGVPITYFYNHDPSRFEILGLFNNFNYDPENGLYSGEKILANSVYTRGPVIDGHAIYARLIIRRKSST